MRLFGIGSKLKDKLSAQRFEYAVTVHNLSPWPESGRAVAVGWQRGRRRRGATRSVYPSTQPGRLGTVCRFNEKFELTATLYKAPSGSANANQMGPFKKKCLILAVLETDGRTQATAALGRVVIDLAEFAAVDKQETRAFMVSCNRQIHAAVGEPQLLITIRTRWKKSSATVGADGELDDGGSMSTDTTGSRLTANLSSFLRYKYTGQGPANNNEEQDLRGFDSEKFRSIKRREDPALTRLEEEPHDEDELPDSPSAARGYRGGPAGVGMNRARPVNNGMPVGPTAASLPPQPPHNYGYGEGDSLRNRYGQAGAGLAGVGAAGLAGVGAAAAARGSNLSLGGSSGQGNGTYSLSNGALPSGSPRSTQEDLPGANSMSMSHISTPQGAIRAMGLQHMSSMGHDTLQNELLMVSASEITVHLARAVAVNSRRVERAAHGAARRIARTMVCLGPQQAPVFGTHVLRLINSQLEVSSSDLQALAFWWSNLAQLRALVHNCVGNGTLSPQTSDQVAPQVLRLERYAFDSIVSHLWEGVLLPAVMEGGAGAGAPGAGGERAMARQTTVTAASKRTQQEAAIKRWFEGLRQVAGKLSKMQAVRPVNRGQAPAAGHVASLRQQALVQCLKRLDALLFCHLVAQPGKPTPDLLSDYDPSNSIWGAPGAPPPALDDSCLPFSKGLLTFGSGMSVKMTVTRLQQWATSEGGLSDAGGHQGVQTGPGAGTSLFPLLKAVADLLMMPKELLMEASIRRDTCQTLSIRSILHILRGFQPDEYAVDAISGDVLGSLDEEVALQQDEARATGRPPAPPPLSDLTHAYRQPAEELLLGKVLTGMEPGVEYDADSEDELVGFGSMAAPPGATSRFRLLHELWYGGARFRGAVSVASSSRMGSQV